MTTTVLGKRLAVVTPLRKSARLSKKESLIVDPVVADRSAQVNNEPVREASVRQRTTVSATGLLSSTIEVQLPNSCSICFERFDGVNVVHLDRLSSLCRGHLQLPSVDGKRYGSPFYGVFEDNGFLANRHFHTSTLFAAFQQWAGIVDADSYLLRDMHLPLYSDSVATGMLKQCCKACFIASLSARFDSGASVNALFRTKSNGDVRIVCPLCTAQGNGGRSHTLDVGEMNRVFPIDLLRPMWLRLDAEMARRMTPVLTCPHANCSHVQAIANCQRVQEIICPAHGRSCSRCFEPLGRARHKCRGVMRGLVEHGHLMADWRRCPTCNTVIEKNGGCGNMTCNVCSSMFKWQRAATALQ